MEPNRREFQKQCAFQSFCKRVLHNEACNAHDEIRRRRKREVSFCDLALHEERQLYTVDKYFQDEEAEMSKVSGIGENKLRELMDNGELEYVQNGNRRLIADTAIWDWYERAKNAVKPPAEQGG